MPTKEIYRPKICEMCHAPLPESNKGRPRKTCSDRCRQRRRRRYDYTGWRYPRQHDQAWRQAERDLRKLEKIVGRLPDQPPEWVDIYTPTISVRQRILIRMSRGMDVPKCYYCYKPYITEDGVKGLYCSQGCADEADRKAKILLSAIGEWSGKYDPRVDVRLRLNLPIKVCPHCDKPFPEYDRRKIYCSPKCRKAHWREKQRENICQRCGEPFTPSIYTPKGRQKYCSTRCQELAADMRSRARQRKQELPQRRRCKHCGRAFRPRSRRVRFYCNKRCADRARDRFPVSPKQA